MPHEPVLLAEVLGFLCNGPGLYLDATLGDETVDRFLREANPAAREAMAARFDEAMRRDLWRPRRNAVARVLERRAS